MRQAESGGCRNDLELFPITPLCGTAARADPVYYLLMKLHGAGILDYPHLWRGLCRVASVGKRIRAAFEAAAIIVPNMMSFDEKFEARVARITNTPCSP